MTIKKHARKMQIIIFIIVCFFLLLAGCGWKNGHGNLSHQIGSLDSVNEAFYAPSYAYLTDSQDFIAKTEYDMPSGQWFMHNGEGRFGYGLSSGTMEAGEDYEVKLFGHNEEGVHMDRDIRIQLTTRDQEYKQSELIMEDVIHVDTITNEEVIYSNQLPDKENVVYLLSVEILDQQNRVEDTIVSMMYVPTPEINAKLITDKDVYQSSDEKATITIENFGPTFLVLGKDYTIEKKVSNGWKVVPLEIAFEEIGVYLDPDNSYDQTMDLDQLASGDYRVVKSFNSDGLDLSATLAAEFTIE